MNPEVEGYNNRLLPDEEAICNLLVAILCGELPEAESKIWHAHPVWFLDGNPIVGYSKQKNGIRLMFWSGAGFEEEKLNVKGEKFKDASVFYNEASEIDVNDLKRWLGKAKKIQWDYKNLIKRRGKLERIK